MEEPEELGEGETGWASHPGDQQLTEQRKGLESFPCRSRSHSDTLQEGMGWTRMF